MSYADKTRNIAPQIDQGVHLDRSLATTKTRPRKQGEAEVDGRRVQGIGGLHQPDAEVVLGVQCPRPTDKHLGEVGPDAPVPSLVGIAQGASGNLAAKAGMVEFRRQGVQARFDVPQAVA